MQHHSSSRPVRAALSTTLLAALLAVLAVAMPEASVGASAAAQTATASSTAVVRYRLPVAGQPRVVRGFAPPQTRYGAGHRGVDLAVPRRATVYAAASGVVTFAGQVAGRGVVVVAHADGISTEYEPLRPVVRRGMAVSAGAALGTVRGVHGSCPPDRCLHWGARRHGEYLDPMTLLAPLGVVRLLPWLRQ